ncbi:MAG: SH3 domain-containing protein [Propionibacteriales bacterium]|nr:SH3 domain-containing protein [Propionibacteriales bacterium]
MTSKTFSSVTKGMAGAAAALAIGAVGLLAPTGAEAASAPRGTVTVDGLNVRSAPTTNSSRVVTVDRGTTFELRCLTEGPSVGGNTTWFAVGPDVGKWVSANYVDARGTIPFCGEGNVVTATVSGDPVLNSFNGPSIKDESVNEYQPGDEARVLCTVTTSKVSGSAEWYRTPEDWLPGEYVNLPAGTDLPIC